MPPHAHHQRSHRAPALSTTPIAPPNSFPVGEWQSGAVAEWRSGTVAQWHSGRVIKSVKLLPRFLPGEVASPRAGGGAPARPARTATTITPRTLLHPTPRLTPKPRDNPDDSALHPRDPRRVARRSAQCKWSARRVGCSSRHVARSSRGRARCSRGHGNSSRRHGRSSRGHGRSSRRHGNSSRRHGKSSRGVGTRPRRHGRSSPRHGRAARPAPNRTQLPAPSHAPGTARYRPLKRPARNTRSSDRRTTPVATPGASSRVFLPASGWARTPSAFHGARVPSQRPGARSAHGCTLWPPGAKKRL